MTFDSAASKVAELTGKPATFMAAAALVIVWGLTGPLFGYSETWQLVINTGTTIITFLMVFIIQASQNRDTKEIKTELRQLSKDVPEVDTEEALKHQTNGESG